MSRVWDENWFGSTKTLDVHMGWLRRKLGDDAADPRFIHTVRGVGFRFTAPDEEQPVGLRARLLLALAYVLVLAVVALEVPLASSIGRPRSTPRCSSQARAQADVLAASLGDVVGARRGGERARLVAIAAPERPRPRDRGRRTAARCSPTPRARRAGARLRGPAGDRRGAAAAAPYQRDAPLRDARPEPARHQRSRSCATAGRSARCASRRASTRSTARCGAASSGWS